LIRAPKSATGEHYSSVALNAAGRFERSEYCKVVALQEGARVLTMQPLPGKNGFLLETGVDSNPKPQSSATCWESGRYLLVIGKPCVWTHCVAMCRYGRLTDNQ